MRTLILVFASFLFITACKRDNPFSACEKKVKTDAELYKTINTSNYMITDAKINGDCLEIKFGASGCNSKTWVVELVNANIRLDSNPGHLFIKLELTNTELCAAAFQKTVSFDIRSLKVEGTKKVYLNLEGFSQALFYSY